REPVQKRKIAAHDQAKLKNDDQCPRAVSHQTRSEDSEWYDQLHEVIEQHAGLVHVPGKVVKRRAQGVGQRLSLVVIRETRKIDPARITAQLDEASSEHDAERQP